MANLNVYLPDDFYQRLKARAERAQHSIQDELLSLAEAALEDEPIPLDIQEAVASLPVLDDATLWQVAETSHLSRAESREVENMHFKRGRGERLTDAEKRRLAYLLHQSDKTMLVRSHALALLKQRGHDITPLLKVR
jgi:plasmid stability protein